MHSNLHFYAIELSQKSRPAYSLPIRTFLKYLIMNSEFEITHFTIRNINRQRDD